MWRTDSPTLDSDSSSVVEMEDNNSDYKAANDHEMVDACVLELESYNLSGYSWAKAFTILRVCVDHGIPKTVELAQLSALLAMKMDSDDIVCITDITFPITSVENYKKLERVMISVYLYKQDKEPKSYADHVYMTYGPLNYREEQVLNRAVELASFISYLYPKRNTKKFVYKVYLGLLITAPRMEEFPKTVAVDPVSVDSLQLAPPC